MAKNVLDMASSLGHKYTKKGSTNNGEYAGACPSCGGTDRFIIWPKHEKYTDSGGYCWCRQCSLHGDGISFARTLLNKSFPEACNLVGKKITKKPYRFANKTLTETVESITKVDTWEPKKYVQPDINFKSAMEQLLTNIGEPTEEQLLIFADRGLTKSTVHHFGLKYNPENMVLTPPEIGDFASNRNDTVILSKGMVIPIRRNEDIQSVKVRRADYGTENDTLPKYMTTRGSKVSCTPFQHYLRGKPIIIVESDIDAMLIYQEAGDLICPISLGSAQNKPDQEIDEILTNAPFILIALDCDDAGEKASTWWENIYRNSGRTILPTGKDPGEYLLSGGDLRQWVSVSLLLAGYFAPDAKPDLIVKKIRLSDTTVDDALYCDEQCTYSYFIPACFVDDMPQQLINIHLNNRTQNAGGTHAIIHHKDEKTVPALETLKGMSEAKTNYVIALMKLSKYENQKTNPYLDIKLEQ